MNAHAFPRYLVKSALLLVLLAALLIVPELQGQQTAVSAAAVQKPTHVVLKLTPSGDIGEILAHANTANGLKGEAVLEKSFPQTTIHVLGGEGWDPRAVALRLNQLDEVIWAEAGIITPTVESEAFSQSAFEQFSAAAFEQFSAAAFEQFSAAAYEQFSAAAFEQFTAAAFESFSQSAFEQFSAAAFEGFSAAAFEQFSAAAFESFSQSAFEQFSAAAYESFSAAAFEQFSMAAYEGFSAAAFEQFSAAAFEGFSAAAFEAFSQAFYEAFSQAVYEQFVAAVTAALEDAALRSVIDQLATDLILSIRSWQQVAAEGQIALDQINVPQAQAHATGAGVVVAVVDTGIALDHWFVEGAIAQGGVDLIDGDLVPNDEGDGIDNDANGLVDEGVGHGTFIAGLVHLVAPDAKLLPIRVQDSDGGGWSFIVAEGIYKAVDAGADVINISLSIPEKSWVLEEAIQYAMDAGVVVVAAAGNYGVRGDLFPAALNLENVLGVAAVDSAGRLAAFSNYGERTVEVVAPGVELYGPYPGGTGMAYWSGTSFSAGLVSGEVALAHGLYGTGPAAAEATTATAILLPDVDPAYNCCLGSGLIDALGAVTLPPDAEALNTAWKSGGNDGSGDGGNGSVIEGSSIESAGGPTTDPSGDDEGDDKGKRGKAWGKGKDDKPNGKAKGHDKDKDDKPGGKAKGHDKDRDDKPGGKARGRDKTKGKDW